MKFLLLATLASTVVSQAASLYPLAPAEELNFPAHGDQHALIVNDVRGGSFAFLAAGDNGLVQFQGHQYDAISKSWVNRWDSKTGMEVGLPSGVVGLARSENLFMAVGGLDGPIANPGQIPQFSTSADGQSWVIHAGAEPGWMKSLAYGGGTWVATGTRNTVGSDFVGQIQYSKDDGATWHAVMLGDGETLYEACWNGSLWVAVGEKRISGMGGAFLETRVYTSPDGVTWTLQVSPGAVTLNAVVWGHGKWVAVGTSYPFRGTPYPVILNSTDGTTWMDVTPKNANEGGFLSDVDTTLRGFVAVGDNRVIHSYDGIQWEPVYSAPRATFRAVKTTPFEQDGSRLYLLADTGRAFQDTLPENSGISILNKATTPSNLGKNRPTDPLSLLRFVDPRHKNLLLDANGRRLIGTSTSRMYVPHP